MPDVRTFQTVAEAAEKAAAGDFAAAEALLRDAADLQEADLGPLHPDLASTFNNLAVVCEMAEKPTEAERFYRRAHAIAAATLSPDHALFATSRDNLRDFCQARGLPLEEFAATLPPPAPGPAPALPTPPPACAARPAPPAPPTRSIRGASLWAVLILVLLALAAGARLWRGSGPPTSARPPSPGATPGGAAATVAVPDTLPARAPAPAPASAEVEVEAAGRVRRGGAADAPSGARLVTATVCRTLTTSGAWRCDPAGATISPGRVSYYTRIASPRPLRIRHRWFQDDRLRQDVGLRLGVNAAEGYRTFSQHTVGPGDWRVELRAENGALLDEARFAVR